MAILDDVATGIDPDVRGWLSRAVARWPMAVIARTNRRSALLSSWEPFVASQCTKADTIATFFGVGDLIARTATIAYGHGELIVGSSANLAGTGNNYTLDAVPDEIRSAVDLELDYGVAPFTSDRRLASTILDVTREAFQREGVAFAEVEASWREFLAHGRAPAKRSGIAPESRAFRSAEREAVADVSTAGTIPERSSRSSETSGASSRCFRLSFAVATTSPCLPR